MIFGVFFYLEIMNIGIFLKKENFKNVKFGEILKVNEFIL